MVNDAALVIMGWVLSKEKLEVNTDSSAVAWLGLVTLEDTTVSEISTANEMVPSVKVFEDGRVNVAS